MTFSSAVKEELLAVKAERPCCMLAESYGLLLFGRGFSASELHISTENEKVALRYKALTERLALSRCAVERSASGRYRVSVPGRVGRLRVLAAFGYDGTERTRRMNWANIGEDCCAGAFLRGVFLACGTVSSPKKNYHLEFVMPYMNLSRDLQKFMSEVNLHPKTITRSGCYMLYFKDSGEIEDLLTLMGASNSVLEMIAAEIYKDIRNNVNRRTNFESANLDRTVDAALNQIREIELLQKAGALRELPESVRKIAALRAQHPEYSLSQLGAAFSPPLSRSVVNYRLQKLRDAAKKLKSQTPERESP